MIPFDYVEATSLEDAIGLLAEHGEDAHLVAGGTSLALMLGQELVQPEPLVGLRRIPGLDGIRPTNDGGLEIGALTTHRAIERAEDVRRYEPALAEAFSHIGTVRIRAQGTVGGNLAHADPAQDPPPILMVLDAAAVVAGPDGARSIPLSSLFVDYFETSLEPGEIITAVRLPPRAPEAVAVYEKFVPRTVDDYATVAVAASARAEPDGRWRDVRVAVGAAGPTPLRMEDAEAALEGEIVNEPAIAAAGEAVAAAVDPLDDLRGSAEYKREMAGVWSTRALRGLTELMQARGEDVVE